MTPPSIRQQSFLFLTPVGGVIQLGSRSEESGPGVFYYFKEIQLQVLEVRSGLLWLERSGTSSVGGALSLSLK